jgi:hypothetical protein
MPNLGNDPRKFIRNNLLRLDATLWVPAVNLIQANGTVMVYLQDVSGQYSAVTRNRNRKGLARLVKRSNEQWWKKTASIYKVMPDLNNDPNAFAAYVCPYEQDHTHFKTLGNAADVMFTADMTGCTFGVGIPNANGDVLVGHANEAALMGGTPRNPDSTNQRATQQQNLVTGQNGTTAGARIIDPNVYYVDPHTVSHIVTIGLRVNNKWEFYYQSMGDGLGDTEKFGTIKLS